MERGVAAQIWGMRTYSDPLMVGLIGAATEPRAPNSDPASDPLPDVICGAQALEVYFESIWQ